MGEAMGESKGTTKRKRENTHSHFPNKRKRKRKKRHSFFKKEIIEITHNIIYLPYT